VSGGSVKVALFVLVVVGLLVGYFIVQNADYLAAVCLLQLIVVSLWHYETIFFPLLMAFFLWAGMDLPFASVGMTARWLVLGLAAFVGFAMWMRQRRHSYNAFHLVAVFSVIAALVSAVVSTDASTSLLKVLSLFLLFLYGSTGARLATLGRETRFIQGLLVACEITVYASAFSYVMLGISLWGNPNSLGAVMGVVTVPVLFWGMLVAGTPGQRYRRLAALLIAGTLLYISLSRASILASVVAIGMLCVCLRRQQLLFRGAVLGILFLSGAAVLNPVQFETFVDSVTSDVLYKGKAEGGILGSRLSPWQETTKVISERPWFGTGFGTSFLGEYGEQKSTSRLSTKPGTNREHGNSYLALIEYVGIFGILPFAILVFLVARMVFQVFSSMRRTSNPYHCAIPLATVLLAGLIHAFFEDWLTAVGYYLCVFFWTSAFMLRDMVPTLQPIPVAPPASVHPGVANPFGPVVPSQ
jgi:O-antigen ligase